MVFVGKSMVMLVLAAAAFAVRADEDGVLSPRQVLKLAETDVVTSDVRTVRGIVTFVSGLEPGRFVIAPQEQPKTQGLTVLRADSVQTPAVGDLVLVSGQVAWREQAPTLMAKEVDVIRNETLETMSGKQSDYRRGILERRRVSLRGTVREVRHHSKAPLPMTELSLFIDNYTTIVRVPGLLKTDRYLGEPVRIEGLARSLVNENGNFLDAWLEVGAESDIRLIRDENVPHVLLVASVLFGMVLLFAASAFLTLWIRSRRVRHEMEVIAAERRRMAADLHDTIEQHLAGANLLAAGVMALEDTPADVKEAMGVLTGLLANAKAEVRSAVLNLRSAGEGEKTLAEKIGEMAKALEKTGIRTHRCLRGLPDCLPAGVLQDIVLIIREATTNAVKHGHAKTIVFTADPHGEAGFVLRVLNDGRPFVVDSALGPETGHYGLSGMQERALRNRLKISWSMVREWTCVELVSEGL